MFNRAVSTQLYNISLGGENMAYAIINEDYSPEAEQYYAEIILDAASDLSSLPDTFSPGSIAFVADTNGKAYMLNASHVWKEL